MFCQVFFSRQVKRCTTITYKHGIYELPLKLQNDLRLKTDDLGNQETSRKSQNIIELYLVLSLPPKIKILLILAKSLFLQYAISYESQSQSQIFCVRIPSILCHFFQFSLDQSILLCHVASNIMVKLLLRIDFSVISLRTLSGLGLQAKLKLLSNQLCVLNSLTPS